MRDAILVAGGSGLVGANLLPRMRELGLPVVGTRHRSRQTVFDNLVTYDLTDFEQCLKATENKQAVVMCAADIYGVNKDKGYPTSTILPNLKINLGLLEASARNRVETVVVLSSATIYQPSFHPIREEELDLNADTFSQDAGVGWYNRYLEQLAILYSETYQQRVIILRPSSIYGPCDNFNEGYAHVIPSLIKRALNQDSPYVVWGGKHVVRNFIYVEDLVEDIIYALNNLDVPSKTPINIGSDEPITIERAVGTILDVCGHKAEVVFDLEKQTANPYRALDNSKYNCFFGRKSRTPFKRGIEKTVEWYKRNSSEEYLA